MLTVLSLLSPQPRRYQTCTDKHTQEVLCLVSVGPNEKQIRLQVGPLHNPAAVLLLSEMHAMLAALLSSDSIGGKGNMWLECPCEQACTTAATTLLDGACEVVRCHSRNLDVAICDVAPDLTLRCAIFDSIRLPDGAASIAEVLGKGSYGTVHRATLQGRAVAVKIFAVV